MDKQLVTILIVIGYILIRGFIIEPNSLEIVKYDIGDSSLRGVKVAFLSDFHLKKRDYKRLDKIIKLTNKQKPDLVLLGGDFASGDKLSKMMNPNIMAQKLSLLEAPTYSVLGNEDWKTSGDVIKNALVGNGIKVLENNSIRAIVKRRYVDIVGLADYTTRPVKISQSLKKTTLPRILVTHNPDVYYDVVDDVSVILAGHTHGGQVVIPYTKPIFVPSKYGADFASGLITRTSNKMVISKGLGTTNIPIRINCKPEITIINFI